MLMQASKTKATCATNKLKAYRAKIFDAMEVKQAIQKFGFLLFSVWFASKSYSTTRAA